MYILFYCFPRDPEIKKKKKIIHEIKIVKTVIAGMDLLMPIDTKTCCCENVRYAASAATLIE